MTSTLAKNKGASNAQATTKMDGSTQNSALVTGKAASEMNYDSNLTSYLSSYKGSLKAAPLPSDGTSTAESGMAALPPVFFAVPKQAGHQDAAMKLLDFLVNDPAASKILGATRGVPPNQQNRQQVCASATNAGNKAVCDYETAAKAKIGPSSSWFWPSGSSAIKTDFQQVYDNVIFGKSSVADAAGQLVSDAKQSLSS
jgi:multiple sugar transport system substrate-binding protein